MQIIDDLYKLRKKLIQRKLAAENDNEKKIYDQIKKELSNIIDEYEEFTVPF